MTPLDALARDRRLVTAELHPSNAFYGHALLLKRYARLPARAQLPVAVEHGPALGERFWRVDVDTRMPTFLTAAPRRAARFARLTGKHAVAVGPLIAYAPAQSSAPVAGTLVAFPAHSTHHLAVHYDAAAFAERLAAMRTEFPSIRVCLYWRDVLSGLAAEYARRDLECVTAGHMYDPGFLVRLRSIIEQAEAVVTNRLGSHVIYAAALGRPAWIEDQEVDYRGESASVIQRDKVTAEDDPEYQRVRRAFARRADALSPEQLEVVEEVAGTSALRSPEELRELLAEARERYAQTVPRAARAAASARARARWLLWRAQSLRRPRPS